MRRTHIRVSARSSGGFGRRGGGRPVEFVIQTSGTYADLQKYSDAMLDRLRQNPGLADLDTDLKLNKPQLEVKIDRDRVADLGLDVSEVGRTLETMLGGRQVTRFEISGEQYDVIVQLDASERTAMRSGANSCSSQPSLMATEAAVGDGQRVYHSVSIVIGFLRATWPAVLSKYKPTRFIKIV